MLFLAFLFLMVILKFTKNIKNLLDKDGIVVLETGYHPKQMKNPSVGALKNVKWGDEEDAISGDGGMHSSVDRNGKSRKKKKEKMKRENQMSG